MGGSAPGGEGPKPTNEFHLLGPGGPRFPYRKRVLFSPSGEGRQCVAGVDPPFCLESPAGRLSGVICYDLRFPELTRHGARVGADLLLVPAQWPTPRCGILELLTRARAAENQCWVLSCNRAGRASLGDRRVLAFPGSALLADPLGDLVARSSDGDLLIAELTPESLVETRRQVPCARDARRAGLWATVEVPDSET